MVAVLCCNSCVGNTASTLQGNAPMAKPTVTAPVAPATPAATAPATPTITPPVVRTMRAVPGTLQVKANLQYRGARAAWYAVLCAHNGQPAQAYLDHCLQQPPSLPASKRAEPPSGWLSWFVRHGVAVVVPPAAATPPAK